MDVKRSIQLSYFQHLSLASQLQGGIWRLMYHNETVPTSAHKAEFYDLLSGGVNM
jgi:hypothetical protein